MSGVDVVNRRDALELMRKGLDALLAQARELGPAIVGARLVGGGVVHAAGGYWRADGR